MNRIHKLEIVLDADDVLLDCNGYALHLLEQKHHTAYSIDRITDWGLLGIPEDERLTFLQKADFYRTQPALPGAAAFLKELLTMANVTIMTAVYPQFMGERIERLMQLFPFFPMENIIMGKRKEMVQADIMLDDGVHNLLGSGALLPVLFRQPWNRRASGICCVGSYTEFLSLVRIMQGSRPEIVRSPKILCIVGPSGSGKHKLADALCQDTHYEQIYTYTTASTNDRAHCLCPEDFARQKAAGTFLESTYYGSEQYALPRQEIEAALAKGHHAVAVMDISGCMAVHNHYPGQALILYVERNKRDCILSILKKNLEQPSQADRILAIDFEQKNKILADQIIPFPADHNFAPILEHIHQLLAE